MRRLAGTLIITLLAGAACADPTSPEVTPLAKQSSFLDALPWTTIARTDTASGPTELRLASWAPPLETYDTTFVAIQGQPSTHALYFQKQPWQLYPVKYMELQIPRGAEFVDENGNTVPRGTEVRITVHADSGVVRFEFGPHGSRFSTKKPATLSVWWLYADLGSLTGAGLQMWYQPDSTVSWDSIDTEISLEGGYLTAPLYHFSNYAVAW